MADKENPYGKAPKGETADAKSARQKKFYSQQRVNAEETGDQKTTDKIYSKMGKKSHSVDADAGNKAILGAVATGSLGKLGALGKLGRGAKAVSSAKSSGSSKALGAGVQDLGKVKAPGLKRSLSGTVARLSGSPQKALGPGKAALGKGRAVEAESPTKLVTGRTSGVLKTKSGGTSVHTKTAASKARPASKKVMSPVANKKYKKAS